MTSRTNNENNHKRNTLTKVIKPGPWHRKNIGKIDVGLKGPCISTSNIPLPCQIFIKTKFDKETWKYGITVVESFVFNSLKIFNTTKNSMSLISLTILQDFNHL